MAHKQDKGFTLVELLIVIVILGILATVTVFAVRGITTRSQTNACAVEKRALETALEAYYVDIGNQTFPPDLATLQTAGYIKEPVTPGVWTYTLASGSVSGTAGAKCAGA
jgi:prepilin-type N-terminal cleavage/methylation domain-containing protein